jgi:hypothetical protein
MDEHLHVEKPDGSAHLYSRRKCLVILSALYARRTYVLGSSSRSEAGYYAGKFGRAAALVGQRVVIELV